MYTNPYISKMINDDHVRQMRSSAAEAAKGGRSREARAVAGDNSRSLGGRTRRLFARLAPAA
ncbi:hypothetical protein ACSMXN_22450 [Jatrophihabitans sp. DSM 45814]